MATTADTRPADYEDSRYIRPTPLLNCGHPRLQALIKERSWKGLPERERIGAIYDFVRDEILFGYSVSDDMPSSAVLRDGYGHCDTKATLLMSLLRATGIPCRLHGAMVDKRLQRGMASGIAYRLWRADIRHSWVEVFFDGRWIGLDGVILDRAYLDGVRAKVDASPDGGFLGYAVGTDDLANPPIEWRGTDTAIQTAAVARDLGVFDEPDSFYRAVGSNFTGVRGWLYRHFMRADMNRRVTQTRGKRHRS